MENGNVVREGWNGYNVLHDSASRVAALDIGFLKSSSASSEQTKPKFVYLLGSDDFQEEDVPADAFVVYQVNNPISLPHRRVWAVDWVWMKLYLANLHALG